MTSLGTMVCCVLFLLALIGWACAVSTNDDLEKAKRELEATETDVFALRQTCRNYNSSVQELKGDLAINKRKLSNAQIELIQALARYAELKSKLEEITDEF